MGSRLSNTFIAGSSVRQEHHSGKSDSFMCYSQKQKPIMSPVRRRDKKNDDISITWNTASHKKKRSVGISIRKF